MAAKTLAFYRLKTITFGVLLFSVLYIFKWLMFSNIFIFLILLQNKIYYLKHLQNIKDNNFSFLVIMEELELPCYNYT